MTKAISTKVEQDVLDALAQSFPIEDSFNRTLLPRLSMVTQDKTEGKGKAMKVVAEAGTFYREIQTDETNEETGKKIWEKLELGTSINATVIYHRKQLKMYDEATETFTSSQVYDSDNDVISLFQNKLVIAKGTPKELKAQYEYEKDGKIRSKLEDNRILYVLYENDVYQMNIRGSSMYSWMTFAKKVLPPAILTEISSEAKEKGSINWNQMTFKKVRDLSSEEIAGIQSRINEINAAIKMEKAYFGQKSEADKAFDALPSSR